MRKVPLLIALFSLLPIMPALSQPPHTAVVGPKTTPVHAATTMQASQLQQKFKLAQSEVATVKELEDPTSFPTLAAFRIDSTDLNVGSIRAIVGNRAETVDAENLISKIAENAIFVKRTGSEVAAATLPEGLLASLPPTANVQAVKLGYELTASQGVTAPPIRLVALISNNTGLLLNSAHSAFSGGFWVALSNADDPADRRSLSTPITVAVNAVGASEVVPAPLEIADVGRWHPVTITIPNPSGSPYRVGVSADPQDQGNEIDLSVIRPVVQLIPERSHISGWGIGSVAIAVSIQGLASPLGFRLPLSTENGSLTPSSVVFDAQGHATTILRSDSASSTVVRIGQAQLQGEPVDVQFDAPWMFLLCATAGGLLGAFVRGKGRKKWGYALMIGMSSAVLMALAYAIGIDWLARGFGAPALSVAGEAVVFVLGGLAALVGVQVLVPKRT